MALLLATLACSVFVGGPDYPATPIPVSTQAGAKFTNSSQQAPPLARHRHHHAQHHRRTTYILSRLLSAIPAQPADHRSAGAIAKRTNESVWKSSTGHVHRQRQYHDVGQCGSKRSAQDQDHAGGLWSISAPQGLNDAISAFVAQAFTGSLGPAATGFRLESISIGKGVMTVTGRIK